MKVSQKLFQNSINDPTREGSVFVSFFSNPRIANYRVYDCLPSPLRTLFSISVRAGCVIQRNIFPSILFTKGQHVFRQNFGFALEKILPGLFLAGAIYLMTSSSIVWGVFGGAIVVAMSSNSREVMVNNFLLYGMILCTTSKFYVNPWFNEEHEAIDKVWYQMGNKTIPDLEYNASFYAAIWSFTKSLSVLVFTQVSNLVLSSLLNSIIVFKRRREFTDELLLNYAIYGINAGNKSSGTEADVEKANLNLVQLFSDIEKENEFLPLCNTRANTAIDFIIASYSLFSGSPLMTLPWYLGSQTLPRFFVLSVGYSLLFNTLLAFFEAPAERLHQKLNQLKDIITRQITNIDRNAELIVFQDGEDFERKKLLSMLNQQYFYSIRHVLLDAGKDLIVNFLKNFDWLFPIFASMEDVRSGLMKQEEVGPLMHKFSAINHFLTWTKNNFEKLSEIGESIRRLALYRERLIAWNLKRAEIEEMVTNSDEVSFSGKIYADGKHKILLAQGNFALLPRSITHIDTPSGFGKTTLFRILRRVWGDFEDKCTLPKNASIFLPSEVYVLDPDEPLFQTICYPLKHEGLENVLEFVKNTLLSLELGVHIYDNLINLPLCSDKITDWRVIFNWMMSLSDGERKRIAFCNVLLKLHTQEVKFLAMDEPLKGIGSKVQARMVQLLKDEIIVSNPKCIVLYSSHELDHGLKTQTLTVDEQTREYKILAL